MSFHDFGSNSLVMLEAGKLFLGDFGEFEFATSIILLYFRCVLHFKCSYNNHF